MEVTEFQLFQILKDDCVKELHSTCQQIWKTQQWPQDWKRKVFIPVPKKSNAKEFSGLLKKGQKLRASVMHPWRLVLISNGVTTGLRDKLASRGYKEAKQGSHGEEKFGNRKSAEAAKTAGIPNFSQSH